MNLKQKTLEYQKKNIIGKGYNFNLGVSVFTLICVLGFIIYTILLPNQATTTFRELNSLINQNFSWLYVLLMNVALFFLIYLAFSKFGRIRLGGFNAKPQFSTFSWYAMLFSAGIGIGIFFYGVAEPLYHLNIPEGLQTSSSLDNFKMMYLHWGFHAWAIYGLVAVGLGYFAYDKGLPFSIRSLLYPLFKEKIFGWIGDLADGIASVAVLFGLATSLGLGAKQINSGMNYVFNIPFNTTVQLILILLITTFATMSVVSGISKGIQLLSKVNTYISSIFLFLILIIGPTVLILVSYINGFGLYLFDFLRISTFIATDASAIEWQSSWTVFYWAWWISWTPFVGAFIAQISKGRTIKEIAIGTVVIPTIIITFVMTILGVTGIQENTIYNGVILEAVNSNIATSMFEMIKYLTANKFIVFGLSITAILAIVFFFITSSDSGSLVVDNLTSGGLEESPKPQRVFWAFMEGTIAAVVLVMGGVQALKTLQSAVTIIALPFSILLFIVMFALIRELKERYKIHDYNRLLKLKNRIDKLPDDAKFIKQLPKDKE